MNSKVCNRPSGFEWSHLSLPVTQPSTPAPAGDSSAASRARPRAIQKQDPSETGSPFPSTRAQMQSRKSLITADLCSKSG